MWLKLSRTVHRQGLAQDASAVVVGSMIWLPVACLCASLAHAQQRLAPETALEPATASTNSVLQQYRPLTYDDLLRLERLGREFAGQPVTFSPDGRRLAYVRVRPKNAATAHDQPYMAGNDRADIWLAATSGGEATRITTGASDGFGYWAPLWSPDGEHLALLSTRDDNVRLHVWERATGELRRLSQRGADFHSEPVWLSSSEIVFTVLPAGERPSSFDIMRQTPEVATEAWPKVREGTEITSSVLESGVPVDLAARPHGQLLLYDLRSGEARVLFDGDVRDLTPSPDNELVAGFVMTDPFLPRSGRPLPHRADHATHEVRLFDRDGLVDAEALSTVENVILGSLEWAPDGSKFAFAGTLEEAGQSAEPTESGKAAQQILVFTPATGMLDRYALDELNPLMPAAGYVDPPKIRWSGEGRLLVYAREADGERTDWWLIDEAGERQNLTGQLDSAPSELYRVAGAASWVGLSEGELWRVSEEAAEPKNLTAGVSEEVTALAWVDEERAKTRGLTEVLVRVASGPGESALYQIELQGRGPSPGRPPSVEKPRPTAELVEFSPARGLAVFSANDRTGSYLWLAPLSSSEPTLLFETNLFLREIAEAESRRIEYRGLDGDSLSAWILLPPGRAEADADGDASGAGSAAPDSGGIEPTALASRQAPGETPAAAQRHPLVVWVYAGSMAREEGPTSLAELNYPHPLNLQLLAAQGYAVLIPSMPLEPPGQPSDPYLELTKGVLPAVDRAIELGIADPDRIAVMGQSYGGYSTYGLVTQTDRFDAAITLAGLSNLVSLYGQFNGRMRYDDLPQEDLFNMSISESGQLRMGSPPWKDLQRYIRNSPITYVERVHTPLLMIQGDLDYVAVQQAEEFFMALYRQGKRAKFVRYWGEDHVLVSPANVKDMWHHIFAWLDEHLTRDERPTAADQAAIP